jgi:hypothetical protein
MKRRVLILIAGVAAMALTAVAVAGAQTGPGYDDGQNGKPQNSKQRTLKRSEAKSAKSAYLNGRAEIGQDGRRGAGDRDATGTAIFQIVDEQTVCYGFTLDNADTPQVVHIHRGAANVNGDPVITFANVPKNAEGQPSGDPGASSGCKTLTPEEQEALARIQANPRNYYVNMHTQEFPDGAVRGQLTHLLYSNR